MAQTASAQPAVETSVGNGITQQICGNNEISPSDTPDDDLQLASNLCVVTDTGVAASDIDDSGEQEDPNLSSRNRNITLCYAFLAFAGRCLWSQSVLSAFVYLLKDDDANAMGFLTSIMGAAQVVASIPGGFAADTWRRDCMLRFAGVCGAVAVIFTSLAALQRSYNLLGVALLLWGVYGGISDPALTALFADSLKTSDRAKYFTLRLVVTQLGSLVGPIAAFVMFAILGDDWSITECATVMLGGQIICVPSLMLLFLLIDDYKKDRQESRSVSPTTNSSDFSADSPASSQLQVPLLTADLTDSESWDSSGTDDSIENRDHQDGEGNLVETGSVEFPVSSKDRTVPLVIAFVDAFGGISLGISVRYFAVFFLDTLHLDPVSVQTIYAVASLLQVSFALVGLHFVPSFGRFQVVALHKCLGAFFIILMVMAAAFSLSKAMICALYLLGFSLLCSTGGISRSALMDSVPREERGRWSSFESVNMLSWSGSATLGAYLVQWDGLLFNFTVMAALQASVSIPLLILHQRQSHRDPTIV